LDRERKSPDRRRALIGAGKVGCLFGTNAIILFHLLQELFGFASETRGKVLFEDERIGSANAPSLKNSACLLNGGKPVGPADEFPASVRVGVDVDGHTLRPFDFAHDFHLVVIPVTQNLWAVVHVEFSLNQPALSGYGVMGDDSELEVPVSREYALCDGHWALSFCKGPICSGLLLLSIMIYVNCITSV
jgi:hypothetical protein